MKDCIKKTKYIFMITVRFTFYKDNIIKGRAHTYNEFSITHYIRSLCYSIHNVYVNVTNL